MKPLQIFLRYLKANGIYSQYLKDANKEYILKFNPKNTTLRHLANVLNFYRVNWHSKMVNWYYYDKIWYEDVYLPLKNTSKNSPIPQEVLNLLEKYPL